MTVKDYKVMDMPTDLGRRVLMQDSNDKTKWIRDEEWYRTSREIESSLYNFFVSNRLIGSDVHFESIDDVVLRFSDFNEVGQKLLQSGAVDRWLDSFDRPGSKKAFSDVRYLEKALRTIFGRPN